MTLCTQLREHPTVRPSALTCEGVRLRWTESSLFIDFGSKNFEFSGGIIIARLSGVRPQRAQRFFHRLLRLRPLRATLCVDLSLPGGGRLWLKSQVMPQQISDIPHGHAHGIPVALESLSDMLNTLSSGGALIIGRFEASWRVSNWVIPDYRPEDAPLPEIDSQTLTFGADDRAKVDLVYASGRWAIRRGRVGTKALIRCAYIDAAGRWRVQPRYARGTDFDDGVAWIEQERGCWRLIDPRGEILGALDRRALPSCF